MSKLCSIASCTKTTVGRGWCGMHYKRWSVHGDPLYVGKYQRPALERFLDKIDRVGDCWLWSGYIDPKGYARFVGGRSSLAHKFSYEHYKGLIPDGMQVDHIRCVKHCVNPEHLRLTTHKENQENRKGVQPRSKTGVRGVFYTAKGDRFYGMVAHNKKRYYCGSFDTIEEAEQAVVAKRNELFTHNDADRR